MTIQISRRNFCRTLIGTGLASSIPGRLQAAQESTDLRGDALDALHKATAFYRGRVASHGGYVYHYSVDLQRRWGEGAATADQIWVQPPGTPTVGLAYLAAYHATEDQYYLDGATEAAQALVNGQLQSGGWTNSIDFARDGKLVALYRKGRGRGRNNSTFDDGISQSALEFLMRADQTHKFQNQEIHEAALFALDAVFKAQFPNGAFPQIWNGPVTPKAIVKAVYPTYDWKTENRIKEYWDLYTLNDNTTAFITDMLIVANEVYQDKRCLPALQKLGDFLVLAQMPDPQPAWAQQYDYEMRPVWARKFEPPAIAGRESEGAMQTLMNIHQQTDDASLLEPIPKALSYLKMSVLKDGQLARYYELQTNTPLFMNQNYELSYDDSQAPQHYSWKSASHLAEIEKQYTALKAGEKRTATGKTPAQLADRVREIIRDLDEEGRWISTYSGNSIVGQPKFREGEQYLSSSVFSKNVETLSEYLAATKA